MIKKNNKNGLFSPVNKLRVVTYVIFFILLLNNVYEIILA